MSRDHKTKTRCLQVYGNYLLFQVAYQDCEQAIKFGYPLAKLNKLLQRKLHIAFQCGNTAWIAETIREIENLSKKNLYSEKQLNCRLYFGVCV